MKINKTIKGAFGKPPKKQSPQLGPYKGTPIRPPSKTVKGKNQKTGVNRGF